MKPRIMIVAFFALFFLLIDYYVYQGVSVVSQNWGAPWRSIFRYGFWALTTLSVIALLWYTFGDPYKYHPEVRNWVRVALSVMYLWKFFGVIVLFIDDLQRGVRWVVQFFNKGASGDTTGTA